MFEQVKKRLVTMGRAHRWLCWPILALLTAIYCAQGLCDHLRHAAGAARKVGVEAAAQLIRDGKRLHIWMRTKALPLSMERGRRAYHALRRRGLCARDWARARLPVCAACVCSRAAVFCALAQRTATRATSALRREWTAARRGMPQRAMAAAMALVLCLGMLPASAFAVEENAEPAATTCAHEHDETCGGLPPVEPAAPAAPVCTCGAGVDGDGNPMDTTARGDLSKFTDQPNAWAVEAVQWAVGAELISGKGGGILDPGGQATRAETAKILTNFAALPQD